MNTAIMGPKFFSYNTPSPGTWVNKAVRHIRSVGSSTFEAFVSVTSSCIIAPLSIAYGQIANLIQSFSMSESELRVDRSAINDAFQLLTKLISVNAPPPKVFPSGGDTVVFVWEKSNGKAYAFYSDDLLSLTFIPNIGREWQTDIDLTQPHTLSAFANYIGR